MNTTLRELAEYLDGRIARLKAAAIFPLLPEMRKTLTRSGSRLAKVEERLEPLRIAPLADHSP